MIKPDLKALARFTRDAADALGLDRAAVVGSFHFGDTPALADDLLEQVAAGPKRATAGLLAELEAGDDPLPKAGDYWVVTDGRGRPRLLIQSREVRIAPFRTVDDAFAWDEGEGDRSLGFWRAAHLDYCSRGAAGLGLPFSEDLLMLFERFEVLWPPEAGASGIVRRPASDDEWAVYHDLRATLFARYLPDLAYDPEHAENWTPAVRHLALIAGGALLGSVQLRWRSADEASLHLVAIREDQRGRGLGRFMLEQAEAFLRVNGCRRLRVFAEPEALDFYRKLGFAQTTDPEMVPLNPAAMALAKPLALP
jgi:uncharacterized protein YhfF/GNAT superfamily N-acetyltransferase